MAELIWNNSGDRNYEAGVDRGVFYTSEGDGVVWNGLISVTESPSGGESTPYYIDGTKYLNVVNSKEFNGKIEAYTYPKEFAEYDGWQILDNGIIVDEQERKPFGFSYRTGIGNDVNGQDHGYKIHIVLNALVSPTESSYSTIGDSTDPLNFSWTFTTMPESSLSKPELEPLSHFVIDSTMTHPTQLQYIERILYGVTSHTYTRDGYIFVVPDATPRLPTLDEMFAIFANSLVSVIIQENTTTGISELVISDSVKGDLKGRFVDGIFVTAEDSRLTQSVTPGLYTLEA